ncbi:unnamed protein product [Paramecium primaurelia]|uniref:CRAL-TRIO domain-containing protein n=1 Tax=Paramecium primaurelia TaxID=5886 RepID=A0A8S1MWS1_PARPR|nr:unnamed protein product [Paramecium primaurelia]
MFGTQFDYLKLKPRTVEEIHHEDGYVKEGIERTATRRIFLSVEYDHFEKKQIQQFKDIIRGANISVSSDDVLLRFLYAGYFNMTNCLELYKRHIYWLNTSRLSTIPDKVLLCLREGLVYIGGKDYQYRPIIVINLHMMDLYLFDSDAFIHALSILFVICEDYMFYPGKVENIVVIVETDQMSLYNFPQKTFQVILWMMSQNFPQILDRLYLFNPSKELLMNWDNYHQMLDSRTFKKIEIWESKSFAPLAHGFHPDMLERRFGGGMPNLQQYWLPTQIIQQPSSISYKVQKPIYNQGTIQYSLYNDPKELLDRLQQRDAEDRSQEATLKSEPQSSVASGKLKVIDFHQTMGNAFKIQNNGQDQQDLSQTNFSGEFYQQTNQIQQSSQQQQFMNPGFQGSAIPDQQFQKNSKANSVTSSQRIKDQYIAQQLMGSSQKPISGIQQTIRPNTMPVPQLGAPAQSERIYESMDEKLNDSQRPSSNNVQACLIM